MSGIDEADCSDVYLVQWEIDIDKAEADSPWQAAEAALEAIRREGSIANVFTVVGDGRCVQVDLAGIEADKEADLVGTVHFCPRCGSHAIVDVGLDVTATPVEGEEVEEVEKNDLRVQLAEWHCNNCHQSFWV